MLRETDGRAARWRRSGLRDTSSSNEGNDYVCAENERDNPAEQADIGRKPENEQYDCDDGDDRQDGTGCVEHRSPLY